MKTYIHSIVFIMAQHLISAQNANSIAMMSNIASYSQDSLYVISTIGNATAGAGSQKKSYTSTEVFPFLLEGEVTGFIPPQILEGITLTPNPASAFFSLHRNDHPEPLLAELYLATGISLKKYQWPGNALTLNISLTDIPAGMYLVVVTNEDRSKGIQYKVIRQ